MPLTIKQIEELAEYATRLSKDNGIQITIGNPEDAPFETITIKAAKDADRK